MECNSVTINIQDNQDDNKGDNKLDYIKLRGSDS